MATTMNDRKIKTTEPNSKRYECGGERVKRKKARKTQTTEQSNLCMCVDIFYLKLLIFIAHFQDKCDFDQLDKFLVFDVDELLLKCVVIALAFTPNTIPIANSN